MNLPNKLTLGRIFAIPVFIVVFLMGYRYAAVIIFILASLTDMLDGKIARKLFFINKEQLELLINGLMAVNIIIHNEVDLSQFIHQGK